MNDGTSDTDAREGKMDMVLKPCPWCGRTPMQGKAPLPMALLDRLEAAERVCQAADTVISQGYAVEPPIYTAVIAWRSVHKAKP